MLSGNRAGRRRPWIVVCTAAVAAAVLVLVIGLQIRQSAPQAPSTTAQAATQESAVRRMSASGSPASTDPAHPSSSGAPSPHTSTSSIPSPRGGLPASGPVSVSIPAIGVQSRLIELGLNKDGTIEVPAGQKVDHAGWFTGSPTPGEVGPAVILGHVESHRSGASVFFDLGTLHQGDQVSVKRADGRTVHFTVYRVEHYPKDTFPTAVVYSNTAGPELRLITCSGALNDAGTHHVDNTVVYARMSSG